MLRQRSLGFSFVRLLPKETGVRPIVNLRRKKSPNKVRTCAATSVFVIIMSGQPFGHELSINQILQAAFCILSYEKVIPYYVLAALCQ